MKEESEQNATVTGVTNTGFLFIWISRKIIMAAWEKRSYNGNDYSCVDFVLEKL